MILKKKWISLLIAMAMLATVFGPSSSSVVAAASSSQQETENNDHIGSADPISVATGNTLNGTLTEDADEDDWFRFTLTKGSKITVTSFGYSQSTDPQNSNVFYYEIYKSKDLEHSIVDETIGYDENRGYSYWSCSHYLSKGTYYLDVSGPYHEKLNYKLQFKTVEWENFTEPNDYMGQATPVTSGKIYYGLMESDTYGTNSNVTYDQDFFRIKTSAKTDYYMTVRTVDFSKPINSGGAALYVDAYKGNGKPREVFRNAYYTGSIDDGITIGEKTRKTVLVRIPAGTTFFKVTASIRGQYQISFTKKPKKILGIKASKKGAKNIKLRWKKRRDITGYKIYRSTKRKSGYKCIKTIKNPKCNYYIDKKRKKKGRKYYYKVCSYKSVNGYACKGTYSKIVSKRR